MVVRSRDMSFAGGMAVFPGGRVDPADRALAARLNLALEAEEAAHRIAAMRETIEETGLIVGMKERIEANQAAEIRSMLVETGTLASVVERFGLTPDPQKLVPFARWCPRGMNHNRIFDTRFYLFDLGTGAVDITVDATENTRLFWTSAAQALERADAGEIDIIFPTRRNLERLAQFTDFAAARAHAQAIPVHMIVPQVEDRDGCKMLTIPEGLGYPVTGEKLHSAMRG